MFKEQQSHQATINIILTYAKVVIRLHNFKHHSNCSNRAVVIVESAHDFFGITSEKNNIFYKWKSTLF